jgi:hypothetical protein
MGSRLWTSRARIGLDDAKSGLLHSPESREDIPIRVQLGRADHSSINSLTSLRLPSTRGRIWIEVQRSFTRRLFSSPFCGRTQIMAGGDC